MYLALIEDKDFKSGKKLKLPGISKYQGYVGMAINGIHGRWLESGGSHCEMMKRCLDNVNSMTTYDPIRLQGIQLVDVRLALAKVREEKCALFVLNIFSDEEELEAKRAWDEAKKEFEKATKELAETEDNKKKLKDLKKKSEEAKKLYHTARENAKAILEKKEKEYREGIPLKMKKDRWKTDKRQTKTKKKQQTETEYETFMWHLKDMKFGMNNM